MRRCVRDGFVARVLLCVLWLSIFRNVFKYLLFYSLLCVYGFFSSWQLLFLCVIFFVHFIFLSRNWHWIDVELMESLVFELKTWSESKCYGMYVLRGRAFRLSLSYSYSIWKWTVISYVPHSCIQCDNLMHVNKCFEVETTLIYTIFWT